MRIKRIIILLFFCVLLTQSTSCQRTRTFDCGLFSFEYPQKYKPVPIQNSPHMVLKLESDEGYISASYWDYGIDNSTSVWDENIIDAYRNMSTPNGDLVEVTKETLQLKDGVVKCLKIKTNILESNNRSRTVTYVIINQGYLYVFLVASNGSYTVGCSTINADKLMTGLHFKETSNNLTVDNTGTNAFEQKVINVTKSLNEQCPIEIDLCTTFKQVILSGHTIMIKTIVNDLCEEYELVDYNEFKEKMCKNFSAALDKEFVQFLNKEEYSIAYMIYGDSDILKRKISITGNDILRYYQ